MYNCTFGMFYALSAYSAAYSWNIMWLDCIVLIPLIMLGLEKLVDENKCYLYCISLGLCIFTNYYISIMVCISVCLYFIVLMIAYDGDKSFGIYIKRYYAGFLFTDSRRTCRMPASPGNVYFFTVSFLIYFISDKTYILFFGNGNACKTTD